MNYLANKLSSMQTGRTIGFILVALIALALQTLHPSDTIIIFGLIPILVIILVGIYHREFDSSSKQFVLPAEIALFILNMATIMAAWDSAYVHYHEFGGQWTDSLVRTILTMFASLAIWVLWGTAHYHLFNRAGWYRIICQYWSWVMVTVSSGLLISGETVAGLSLITIAFVLFFSRTLGVGQPPLIELSDKVLTWAGLGLSGILMIIGVQELLQNQLELMVDLDTLTSIACLVVAIAVFLLYMMLTIVKLFDR